MKSIEFLVINSFAPEGPDHVFGGNPAAVFRDATDLTPETMQQIARQMNLVETVFINPAPVKGDALNNAAVNNGGADYSFRYFTPTEELPIAGHPTVAGVLALWQSGLIDRVNRKAYRIQTKAGVKEILLHSGPVVMMEQQTPQFLTVVTERDRVAAVLGLSSGDLMPELPVQAVDTGLGHLIVPVRSLEALLRAKRNIEPLKGLCSDLGIREAQLFAFETFDPQMTLHTRNICPREGLEDPGCGVGNGALGAYLLKHCYGDRKEIAIKAEQGQIVEMPCVIETTAAWENDKMRVMVGGSGKVRIQGTFFLE